MAREDTIRSLTNELNAARDYLSEVADAEEAVDYVSEALVVAEQDLASFGETLSAGETMHVQPAAKEGAERRRELLERAVEALDSAQSHARDAGEGPLEEIIRNARESAGRVSEGS